MNAREASDWEEEYVRFYNKDRTFRDVVVGGAEWGNGLAVTEDAIYRVSGHSMRKFVQTNSDEWTNVWEVTNWGASDEDKLGRSHNPVYLGDEEWLVFNNGPETKAVHLRLDEETGESEILWEEFWTDHRGEEIDFPMVIDFFGSVKLLQDGNYLINWGSLGELAQLDIVTPDHETVCTVQVEGTYWGVNGAYTMDEFPVNLLAEGEK